MSPKPQKSIVKAKNFLGNSLRKTNSSTQVSNMTSEVENKNIKEDSNSFESK